VPHEVGSFTRKEIRSYLAQGCHNIKFGVDFVISHWNCARNGILLIIMKVFYVRFCFVNLCDIRACNCKQFTSFRVTSTKCRIYTVVSPDDGHIVVRNMQRKEINILRKIVHQVGFIYKIMKVL